MRLENGVNISIGDLLSTETFQMGKIHKEIAMFMVEAAKNEEYDDQRLVKVTMKFHCVYPPIYTMTHSVYPIYTMKESL